MIQNQNKHRSIKNWSKYFDYDLNQQPINLLEIGVNTESIEHYGSHPESKFYYVTDNEPTITHPKITFYGYSQFTELRGIGFDIIHIGQSKTKSILDDALLAFKMIKPTGIIILDDYDHNGPSILQPGIIDFVNTYSTEVKIIGKTGSQVFVRKCQQPKLIILIISHPFDYQAEMEHLWLQYMCKHPNIKSYFIKCKEDIDDEILVDNHTIYVGGSESVIPGILDKTIKTIEFLLANDNFDYMFRTNLSTVVDLDILYSTLKQELHYAGFVGVTSYTSLRPELKEDPNIIGTVIDTIAYVSGSGIIFNRQVCEKLVESKSKLDYKLVDDVAIGKILHDEKIAYPILQPRCDPYYLQNCIELLTKSMTKGYFNFRCKSDVSHSKTIEIMKKVISLIYDKNDLSYSFEPFSINKNILSNKQLKLFNLDLHISVIADVKARIAEIDPMIEIVNWSISDHTWVFGKRPDRVEHVNQYTWKGITEEMIANFVTTYDEFLRVFDGFIVTHTSIFCLLYEKFQKPIILVNSCRYEQPFCWVNKDKFSWINERLSKLQNLLVPISNNKADQAYLQIGTSINSSWIPSICDYTKSSYIGDIPEFIYHGSDNILISHPMIKHKNSLPWNYKWQQMYNYSGIIHMPYEISTMSIFEQYTANVPLFFPSMSFLKTLLKEDKIVFQGPYSESGPTAELNAVLKKDHTWIDFWIDKADYYDESNIKYITYYDSFENLYEIIDSITKEQLQEISNKMKEWNVVRHQLVRSQWKSLIEQKFRNVSI